MASERLLTERDLNIIGVRYDALAEVQSLIRDHRRMCEAIRNVSHYDNGGNCRLGGPGHKRDKDHVYRSQCTPDNCIFMEVTNAK